MSVKYITTHKQTEREKATERRWCSREICRAWKFPLLPHTTRHHRTVTANDLDVVIEGWERKFQHLSESIRDIQLALDKFNANMDSIVRNGRAREGAQERRIQEMHECLTQFLERCDPAHLTAARRFEAPVIS